MESFPFSIPNLFFDRIQKDHAHTGEDLWFIFKGNELLVDAESMKPYQIKDPLLIRSFYMGTYDGHHIHVGEMDLSAKDPSGALLVNLKMLYSKMDEELYAIAGRASQLLAWERTHQFCGQCANKMVDSEKERAKVCPVCKLIEYPKIAPVMMALIERGDEILLARGYHFQKGVYSILAGFVDPGETLEQCVKREISEEVGLEVEELKYFGSQSWPFPNSLLIAFICKWKSGEIQIDPVEIEDARWFKKDQLPPIPPKLSIAHHVIQTVLRGG